MENNQNEERFNQAQAPDASVSGVFGHSWEILKRKFPELLLIVLVQILFSMPFGFGSMFFPGHYMGSFTNGMFSFVYGILVMMPVSYGSSWVFLKAVRGEPFRVG